MNTAGTDDDGDNNTVWAILSGRYGEFAAVPEPGTFLLAAAGAAALLPLLLRRKLGGKRLEQTQLLSSSFSGDAANLGCNAL